MRCRDEAPSRSIGELKHACKHEMVAIANREFSESPNDVWKRWYRGWESRAGEGSRAAYYPVNVAIYLEAKGF